MKLNENPEIIEFPASNYVFVEFIGPFEKTARQAWELFHQHFKEILKYSKKLGVMATYKINPQMIYRAGAVIDKMPDKLPAGFKMEHFAGGKYARFTLSGSYSQLPEACGRVMEIVEKSNIPQGTHWFIENYVNDPSVTPENNLITEIMIPMR